jgi:hypothetical protein
MSPAIVMITGHYACIHEVDEPVLAVCWREKTVVRVNPVTGTAVVIIDRKLLRIVLVQEPRIMNLTKPTARMT